MENKLEKKKESGTDEAVILAQWQTCVEMANSVSQRRDTMNNLCVTLNLAIVAAISFIWDTKTIALLIAGALVCIIWLLFIRNFRELNRAKFYVINRIETCLPVNAFDEEWEFLEKNKKYIEGTKLERSMPLVFLLLYAGIFIFIVMTNSQGGKA